MVRYLVYVYLFMTFIVRRPPTGVPWATVFTRYLIGSVMAMVVVTAPKIVFFNLQLKSIFRYETRSETTVYIFIIFVTGHAM